MCIKKLTVLITVILALLAVPIIYARAASFGDIQTQINSIARQIAALANPGQASLNPSKPICSGSLSDGDCTTAGGKFVCTCGWSGDAASCPCSCVCSPCANEGDLVYMVATAYEKKPHSCCAGLTAVMNAKYTDSECVVPGDGTQRCVKYGDEKCEKGKGENECNSLKDCPYSPVCGNKKCETNETATNCAPDCGKSCEETCKAQGYTYSACNSYAVTAGTAQCKEGYTSVGTAKDCYAAPGTSGPGKTCCCTKPVIPTPVCGNSKCETDETATNCPKDCGNKCEMASSDANPRACRTACKADETAVDTNCDSDLNCCKKTWVCGNGKCETGETAVDCPQDCGKSCEETCKAQGYTYSACNSYAVTPGTLQCKEGYTSVGTAKDCYAAPGTAGGGKACCCTKVVPVCANEEETIDSSGTKKCCPGLLPVGTNTDCATNLGTDCLNTWVCKKPACAKEGETFSDTNKQCCPGLEKTQKTAPCSAGETCAAVLEYTCVNKPIDICQRKLTGSPTDAEKAECAKASGKILCGNGWCSCSCAPATCAKDGETIISDGKKCCAGLIAQTPDGCLESEGCKPGSWICKNKHADVLAEINKIKTEIRQMMQRLQELMKELR